MQNYLDYVIRETENRVRRFLRYQVLDKDRIDYGALESTVIDVKPTIYAMTEAVSIYFNKRSVYYLASDVYDALSLAMDFVKRIQNSDGTFDLPVCNFRSAPDTSFCFKRLITAYRIIDRWDRDHIMDKLKDDYKKVMLKALYGIMNGGFHTPNHRWAISAALIQGYHLFSDHTDAEKFERRARQYLQEGIDCDTDGQYSERSTGNYNAVVNASMISLYEETKNPVYLEYMIRNLKMMLTFIDSDGTIFTDNSTRQDKGREDFPTKYFYQYLYAAVHIKYEKEYFDQSEMINVEEDYRLLDGAAGKIISDCYTNVREAPDCLYILMLNEDMNNHVFESFGIPDTYRIYYKETGVLRCRTPKYTYTLINEKSSFLFIKFKSTLITVKIGESYCDIRNFIPSEIEVMDKKCTLTALNKGWYYLPWDTKQDTVDWWKMDHQKRNKLCPTELKISVCIDELENGIHLHVKTNGLERFPLRVEFGVPDQSILETNGFYMKAFKGENMIVKNGMLSVTDGEQQIQIGPGFGEHNFGGHYSGEEKNANGFTVYFNAYTPCDKEFSIICKK